MVRFRKLRGEQEDADRSTADEEVAKAPGEAAAKGAEEEPLEEALAEEIELEDQPEASEDTEQGDPLDEIMDEDEDVDDDLDDDLDLENEDIDLGEKDPDAAAAVEDLEDAGDTTALKELAARMAVLQSNLENVQGSRGDLEEKLATMEDRMLRLGNLAEAVSKEYNPFIAENSPEEPSWQGQGAPPGAPAEKAQAQPGATPPPTTEPAPPPEPETSASDPTVEDAPTPGPELGTELGAQGDPEPEDPVDQALGGLGKLGANRASDQDPIDALESFRQRAGSPKGDPMERLQENFMLLEWVGLMLRRVGRANLLDLLEYYEGLGWMSPAIKRRVVRVAVGIDAPKDGEGDGSAWRGDLDLHERSLVTIQRLEGNEITAADIEGLRMDMRRLFGE